MIRVKRVGIKIRENYLKTIAVPSNIPFINQGIARYNREAAASIFIGLPFAKEASIAMIRALTLLFIL